MADDRRVGGLWITSLLSPVAATTWIRPRSVPIATMKRSGQLRDGRLRSDLRLMTTLCCASNFRATPSRLSYGKISEGGGSGVMWIMGLLPALAFLVVSLGTALFSVWWGAVVYAGAIYFVVSVILISLWSVRAPPDPVGARKIILSPEEESLFKRYYAFFRFPFGTQNFAHFVNYARMFGVIWIAISLWQRVYWMAAAVVVFYLISGSLMWRLSPIAHFKEGAERGHEFAVRGLARM